MTDGGAASRSPEPPRPPAPSHEAGPLVARNESRGTILADHLEVAGGLWGKFMGLMGRAELPAGSGLWLPGSNGIHMMFMRFRIDAVFVDRADAAGARRVLSVHPDLATWRGLVPLVRGAHGVLELPSGSIAASRTAVGDVVRLESPDAGATAPPGASR